MKIGMEDRTFHLADIFASCAGERRRSRRRKRIVEELVECKGKK
jgi:hypothetical protein